MTKYLVRITDDEGDIHIYTDASSIEVNENSVDIAYVDGDALHIPDRVDEIVIKPSR